MAQNWLTVPSYVGRVLNTKPTTHPYGNSKPLTSEGTPTGSPWDVPRGDEQLGFWAACLKQGGIVPNGLIEAADNSQYLDGIVNVVARQSLTRDIYCGPVATGDGTGADASNRKSYDEVFYQTDNLLSSPGSYNVITEDDNLVGTGVVTIEGCYVSINSPGTLIIPNDVLISVGAYVLFLDPITHNGANFNIDAGAFVRTNGELTVNDFTISGASNLVCFDPFNCGDFRASRNSNVVVNDVMVSTEDVRVESGSTLDCTGFSLTVADEIECDNSSSLSATGIVAGGEIKSDDHSKIRSLAGIDWGDGEALLSNDHGHIDISGAISVVGDKRISLANTSSFNCDGGVTITGGTTSSSVLCATGSNLNISGPLSIPGNLEARDNSSVLINGSVASNRITVNDMSSMAMSNFATGLVNVLGGSDLFASVITGAISGTTLNVNTGCSVEISGVTFESTFNTIECYRSGSLYFAGNVVVGGGSGVICENNATMTVIGNLTVNQGNVRNRESSLMEINGNTLIVDNLNVETNSNLVTGNLTVNGDATVTDTSNITQKTVSGGGCSFTGNLTMSGGANITALAAVTSFVFGNFTMDQGCTYTAPFLDVNGELNMNDNCSVVVKKVDVTGLTRVLYNSNLRQDDAAESCLFGAAVLIGFGSVMRIDAASFNVASGDFTVTDYSNAYIGIAAGTITFAGSASAYNNSSLRMLDACSSDGLYSSISSSIFVTGTVTTTDDMNSVENSIIIVSTASPSNVTGDVNVTEGSGCYAKGGGTINVSGVLNVEGSTNSWSKGTFA